MKILSASILCLGAVSVACTPVFTEDETEDLAKALESFYMKEEVEVPVYDATDKTLMERLEAIREEIKKPAFLQPPPGTPEKPWYSFGTSEKKSLFHLDTTPSVDDEKALSEAIAASEAVRREWVYKTLESIHDFFKYMNELVELRKTENPKSNLNDTSLQRYKDVFKKFLDITAFNHCNNVFIFMKLGRMYETYVNDVCKYSRKTNSFEKLRGFSDSISGILKVERKARVALKAFVAFLESGAVIEKDTSIGKPIDSAVQTGQNSVSSRDHLFYFVSLTTVLCLCLLIFKGVQARKDADQAQDLA